MKKNDLHAKAVRLAEGGLVEFQGLVIGAKLYPMELDTCYVCEMDSLCNLEMCDLCCEIVSLARKNCVLYLPNP